MATLIQLGQEIVVKRTVVTTCLFLDIGDALLIGGWNYEAG